MQDEVQCIFHTNHHQDAHESLLNVLDILHNHTKIDIFSGLAFPQEAMKYTSVITNTFYGIINSTHTCTACKWVTITSSKFCELEIALENDIGTGISMSKYYNCTKKRYSCNSNKSHRNHLCDYWTTLITTTCINRFHQSRTGRLTKNTVYILCNRSISLTDFDGQLMGLLLHKRLSINSGHYISMVKVGDIWFECDDVTITKIEFNNL